MWKSAEIYIRKTRRCLAFLFSAFLFISTAFSATLPSGYTELEYIESSGTQYIDTGVKLSDNDKTYYDVDFEITRNTSYRSLWGAYGGYSSNGDTRTGYLYVGANYLQFAVGASNDAMLTSYPTSGLAGVRHHWLLYVDDNTKERTITNIQNGSIISTSTFSGTLLKNVNICLFGFPGGERSYLKLYSFKITINGTPVRDFIPARRNSDGVLGMYDTVNNVFYTNSGTGTFIAGPAVLPCGYTRLEYIESSGTQYIDTGVYADKNTEIEMVAKTNGAGSQYLFGVSDKRFLICQRKADDCLTFYFGNQTTPSSAVGYADFHKIEIKKQSFYVDDISVGSFASLDNFSQTDTAYLFDAHNHDWVSDTGSKMKYLKMWQSGALVRDYIPAKDQNDVIGMYDSVSGNFFPNAETKYTQVEYLKSSGTQYIEDASFTTITTGAIEIKTKDLANGARFAGWASGPYANNIVLATPWSIKNDLPFCYGGTWNDKTDNTLNIEAENVFRYEFQPGLQTLYANGDFSKQATYGASNASYTFRLFMTSGATYTGSTTIYYCKVFNDNGLVRHYIPVRRDSDGVLGMYDTTTRAFLQNVGTGTFTAGADLDTFPNSFIAGPTIASNNNCPATISIQWDGLSEPEASGMCVYGETFTAPSTAPTAPSGLKFLGWIPR